MPVQEFTDLPYRRTQQRITSPVIDKLAFLPAAAIGLVPDKFDLDHFWQ
jgi:hypothetical protein|tara:strand:- start:9066 stop:9212 length:147 start_codon:yes stop_codon:yes gene_type:complete